MIETMIVVINITTAVITINRLTGKWSKNIQNNNTEKRNSYNKNISMRIMEIMINIMLIILLIIIIIIIIIIKKNSCGCELPGWHMAGCN